LIQDPDGTCFVCGDGPAGADNPAIEEEFYPGLWCHFHCLNSPGGMAWRGLRKQADPRYARYLRLMNVGLPIECASCSKACRISAKARGMGAGSWEACCTACSNFTTLNGYAHESDYRAIMAAEQEMLFDEHNDWRRAMVGIAKTADANLDARTCKCGAPFSVAAQPRCPTCRAVLMDSFFHYAYIPYPTTKPITSQPAP
jgi:hypothetical protein